MAPEVIKIFRYDLEEFRTLILEKIEKAERDLELIKSA